MSRPIRAVVSTSALHNNVALARAQAGAAGLWAVVKAHGYGHGLLWVAQNLAAHTDGYALLELEEAYALRRVGLNHPILLLEGFFAARDLPHFVELGLTPVLHNEAQLRALEESTLTQPLPVYVKVNTGMNRLGFLPARALEVVQRLARLPQVASITLMSHFAEADDVRGIEPAYGRFQQFHQAVQGQLGRALPRSLANSATLLRYPQIVGGAGSWGRPGIVLYGASPFPHWFDAKTLGLQPVMTLSSQLIAVQHLAPGERVGYGGLFTAPEAMRIGIVACGYGDGYPRHAPTGTPIAVAGKRTRTLGRVSMDMLMVDLTPVPEADVGAPVVLWGGSGSAYVPADEVAHSAGTIAYELFCALAPRVPVTVA